MAKPKILFLLKYREVYSQGYGQHMSSGLANSCRFVADMLSAKGYPVNVEHAVDGNCIDRLVTLHKPDVVIIEAYWVTPDKLKELIKLHKKVKWVVRNHSEVPFLACEGIAVKWSAEYIQLGVWVASNSKKTLLDLQTITRSPFDTKFLTYLPNYYPTGTHVPAKQPMSKQIDISCFGAIRPLKNQLIQAMAAIRFADDLKLQLNFHMNGTRIESNGNPVYHNLRDLFDKNRYHKLVLHDWLPHDKFVALASQMHLCLQVSFSESFNIVAADHCVGGVPIVASEDVVWLNRMIWPDSTDTESIVRHMHFALVNPFQPTRNLKQLTAYSAATAIQWDKVLAAI